MIQSGIRDLPPGAWSDRLKAFPYNNARRGDFLTTETLKKLVTMEPKRELRLRNDRRWEPEPFDQILRNNVSCVEASLGFVVGEIAPFPCSYCKCGFRSFPVCMIVPGCPEMTACVGCHWHKNGHQCDHHIAPEEDTAEEDTAMEDSEREDTTEEDLPGSEPDLFDLLEDVTTRLGEILKDTRENLGELNETNNLSRGVHEALLVANQDDEKKALAKTATEHFQTAFRQGQAMVANLEKCAAKVNEQMQTIKDALKKRV
ncbi:hypothetical protein N7456_010846 [Penicillium angulare]|uniref:Uncharacterized protein n=1 Tax=Penicillium angulare TaxID=116970 RepID=A0A9W9ESX9_9EURO|nr:hypothetical protein N7456_010846 [Penicillium angulare]